VTDAPGTSEQVPVRVLGGPTTLIEYGGLRFLTDPTFDAPGEYPLGGGRSLTKTAPSAVDPADLGPSDAVLLSHDQHPDNLDGSGRALLADVPLVLTTRSAADASPGPPAGSRPGRPWSCPAPTAAPSR
jgi:L-ascorbate metabolism protein UlaG (beta-lactamase superfamily)